MKDVPLPKSMFSERVIPIADELPKPLKIESMKWGEERSGDVPQAEPEGLAATDRRVDDL